MAGSSPAMTSALPRATLASHARAAPMKEPVRLLAVAHASAGARGEPRHGSADNRRRSRKESENDGAPARAGIVVPGAGSGLIHASLRVATVNAGDGGDQADEIDAILRLQATMARGGEQDARGLGAWIVESGVGAALGAKQAVEIEGDEALAADRPRRSGLTTGGSRETDERL